MLTIRPPVAAAVAVEAEEEEDLRHPRLPPARPLMVTVTTAVARVTVRPPTAPPLENRPIPVAGLAVQIRGLRVERRRFLRGRTVVAIWLQPPRRRRPSGLKARGSATWPKRR